MENKKTILFLTSGFKCLTRKMFSDYAFRTHRTRLAFHVITLWFNILIVRSYIMVRTPLSSLNSSELTASIVLANSVRQTIISFASRKLPVTYGTLMTIYHINRFQLAIILSQILIIDYIQQTPPVACLVINQTTGTCGEGFINEFLQKFKQEYNEGLGIITAQIYAEPPYLYAKMLGEKATYLYIGNASLHLDFEDILNKKLVELCQEFCFDFYKK